jgi:peptide chain release factor 3
MANAKSTIEEAWPGDVIGLYDNGSLKIGDGLTEGEHLEFKGIPSFSPEILKEAVNLDPFKTKQLEKGVRQLTDEGLAQLFILQPGNIKIIGTVGELQYDVIRYRLEHEYGAKCRFDMMPYIQACWFDGEDQNEIAAFLKAKSGDIAFDKEERPVFLVRSEWILRAVKENYPGIRFYNSSEFRNTV